MDSIPHKVISDPALIEQSDRPTSSQSNER